MASVLPIVNLPADGSAADIDFERRFGGIARLYGDAALAAFRGAHVCVIGVGGVGSWAVEALARTAIGKITMIDLDHLAESNVNRQIHALTETLGMAKVGALRERIAQINPYCEVTGVEEFIDPANVEQMLPPGRYDYVIDAIDNAKAKVALIVHCRQHHIPLVTIGSAGGQVDPTRIEVCDLSRTEQEPLLARVRKRLRAAHGFPRDRRHKFHIDAVWSSEPLRQPDVCDIDEVAAAEGAAAPSNAGITGINCAGYGSAVVVTASFGFVAAGHVLRKLAEAAIPPPA
ncbi:MAG: tRNA cyclic N6-threonylcarbamoyladenosine(37) synthase TcdA [Pseudomonadota bacterium]